MHGLDNRLFRHSGVFLDRAPFSDRHYPAFSRHPGRSSPWEGFGRCHEQGCIPIDGAVINLEVEFLMSKWAEFPTSAQAAYAFAHADMRDMAHKGLSPETDPGQSTAGIDDWAFLRSKKC